MVRIQMIRSDTRHPDKRCRHQGRASCEVAGQRFETRNTPLIYPGKLKPSRISESGQSETFAGVPAASGSGGRPEAIGQ